MIGCIRLTTGEDILGTIEDPESSGVGKVVKEPVQLAMMPDPKNQGNVLVQFIPFLAFAKSNTIQIPEAMIGWQYEPSDNIRNAYSERFGSGIVVPTPETTSKLLLTEQN
jgi:hypothetical protein